MKKIKLLNFLRSYLSAGLIILSTQTAVQAQVPYGSNQAAGHYLDTRGIKLYYETYGKGEPLILLHNNGASMKMFLNQIPYFSKNYRVIAVDSRAHGRSVDTKDSLSFEMMADDLNSLLDHLHLKNCNVIGWSDGGITGLVMAMRHPDKVKKLVVSGPNLRPDTTALVPSVYHYLESAADSVRKLPATAENKNILKVLELDLLEPHISPSQLHRIKCPVLVMGGDHDGIPVPHLVEIYQHIPKAYLWIVPNTGHYVAALRKDQFNARIAEFLSQPYRKIEGLNIFEGML